ncbi:LysR family transcriptional regulator [Shewanella sp.]|uniref:LysR family transcriptional regulator n=1 Tax=Shewanella sp. TaxID=50422 RepID=UPI001A492449|nr:LysR family transcriptional regulator [Shewanella sp.]MBL4814068.1 LysR family transcriptional regulator [Shewanella sp.]MCJ8304733.1 LysR family transcriptional regulator [Shewanella sp.]
MSSDSKLNPRQIEAFQKFMLTGSVTNAASLMHVSQPAVSRLLGDLEKQLGFKLFVRSHNKLEITPEAHLFYQDVERLFTGLDSLSRSAAAIVNNNRGKLRIGAMPVCSDSFLHDVVADFAISHPQIRIELETAPRNQLIEMVLDRKVDVAIIADVDIDNEDFDCWELYQQKARVFLPLDHPLANRISLTPKDIQDERFMTLSYGSPFRTRVENLFIHQGIKRNIVFEARSQHLLLQLVKRGVGIAILDPFILLADDRGIVTLPLEPTAQWSYFLVQARVPQQSTLANAFRSSLLTYMKNLK